MIHKAKSNELKSETAKTDEALAQMGDVDPARGETALAFSTGRKERRKSDSVQTTTCGARYWISFV